MRAEWRFLFDSDCCFCEGFARFVERRSGGKVAAVALKEEAETRELARSTPAPPELHGTFHLVQPGRRWLSGPDALPELAALLLPAGALWRAALRASPAALRRGLCRWVSETRWGVA